VTVDVERCGSCGAEVLTSDHDVLGDVFASIVVDPTPLTPMERAACVVAGRAVYRYEEAAHGALGLSHWATAGRKMGAPDCYIPRHRCGHRFTGTLDTLRIPAQYDVVPF
jgi:hypothetical protein